MPPEGGGEAVVFAHDGEALFERGAVIFARRTFGEIVGEGEMGIVVVW